MIEPRFFPEVEAFVSQLDGALAVQLPARLPRLLVRAPARLDVMGGIADYTGSLVLEATLDRAVVMAAQRRDDQHVLIVSRRPPQSDQPSQCRWPLSALYQGPDRLASPQAFAAHFDQASCPWAKYVAGVLFMLLKHARLLHLGGGATFVFDSTIPPGAAVASSAAIEVATCLATCALYDVELEPLEAARICQQAENVIAGAPCGIMDQVTCLLGQPNTLLQIRCQPHDVLGPLELPEGTAVMGVNSGVRHSIGGKKYIDTRVAAFMGHRMICQWIDSETGPQVEPPAYLANVTPVDFVKQFRDRLPTKIKGADFLDQFGHTEDDVTCVDPDRIYKVRSRTEHHVYENARVHRFAERLSYARRTGQRDALVEAGQLMYASHWSYGQRCGLATIETDLLVNLIRGRDSAAGFYGAKITGGGAGGTVAVLLDDTEQAHAELDEVVSAYEQKTGRVAEILAGTSPGALAFGVRKL